VSAATELTASTTATMQPVLVPDPALLIGELPADPEADTAHLLGLAERMRAEGLRVLGFPGNLSFDYSALAPLLSVLFNNVGDPSSPDASNMHAKAYEQAVLRYFAEIAGARMEDTYGYMTSGGSEGVLFGLATARRRLPHAYVYASDQAHYSVPKAAALLGMKLLTIPSSPDGTMDPDALRAAAFVRRRLDSHGGHGPGAIVLASIGTTMRGAVDDVVALREAASAAGEVYVHADAASGGIIAAYAPTRPHWNFRHGVDSLSISGHKIVGCPVPCGVVLARRELVPDAETAEYLRASDRTLGCSRSGLAALLMWAALRRLGHAGMRQHILRCLEVAEYASEQLAKAGANPSRFPGSLTVCFDRPAKSIVDKWHLACQGDTAHIITVGHVSPAAVDELSRDLAAGSPALSALRRRPRRRMP
jgi:histidine decarboxylase